MKPLALLSITTLLLAQPMAGQAAHEGGGHHHDHPPAAEKSMTDIAVNPGDVLLEVHGIVCSFCSQGIQNKLSELPFVDTSKYIDGSLVEIESQRVTVAIKPGETADIQALYRSVTSGGYEPAAAYVRGENDVILKFNGEGQQCTTAVSC